MPARNAIALNAHAPAAAAGLALALAADGGAPEWVQVMPAGPEIQGRDGRRFSMPDPAAVVQASQTPFAFDWEHGQDLLAPTGQAAPAAGWVEELAVRDGAIWARVDWTERARASIAAREYRFVSPAILHTREGDVVAIVGAALVNRPNFDMTALNSRAPHTTDGVVMKELLKALGLAETATEADALTAIAALNARTAVAVLQPAEGISLERFVPRADYDAALNRATAAEQKLADRSKADHQAKVTAAIEGALKAGKIAPASREFYLATCATAEGLAAFDKFVAGAASVFTETDVGRDEPARGAVALNAEQKAAAKALGIPEAAFAKSVAPAA